MSKRNFTIDHVNNYFYIFLIIHAFGFLYITRKINQSIERGFTQNKSGTCVLSHLIASFKHAHYKGQAKGWIQGGPGPGTPLTTKMRPQYQNSTKLRPQNGCFGPKIIIFFKNFSLPSLSINS